MIIGVSWMVRERKSGLVECASAHDDSEVEERKHRYLESEQSNSKTVRKGV